MMGEEKSSEAMDAAIIASAQKIEHYEISGYGTARAFARELNLVDVANLLTQTLNEEYQADDSLTQLAVGRLNIEAEYASKVDDKRSGNGHSTIRHTGSGNGSSTSKRTGSYGHSSNGSQKSSSKKRVIQGKSKSNVGGRTKKPVTAKKSASKNVRSSKGSSAKKIAVSARSSAGRSVKKSSSRSAGNRSVLVKNLSKSAKFAGL